MCKTRWVDNAFEIFTIPILCCLECITDSSTAERNRETSLDAQSFLLLMSQFSIIITLIATQILYIIQRLEVLK